MIQLVTMVLRYLQGWNPHLIMHAFKATVEWCKEQRPVPPELATFINDPYPLVRSAAINAIYTALDPDLQWRFILALVEAIYADLDPGVRLAAINATGQLLPDLAPDLQLDYLRLVLQALDFAICDFKYWQVQTHAASAMINISKNYPPDILTPYLSKTVGTLLEDHASSRERLELQHQEDIALEDIASDRNQIRASESLLRKFESELPHDTWGSIRARLTTNHIKEFIEIWVSISRSMEQLDYQLSKLT